MKSGTEIYDLERSWIILLGCEDYSLSPFGQNSWKPFGWWNYYTKWISFEEEGLGLWKDPDITRLYQLAWWLSQPLAATPKIEPHPVGKKSAKFAQDLCFFFRWARWILTPKSSLQQFFPPIFPFFFSTRGRGTKMARFSAYVCLGPPWKLILLSWRRGFFGGAKSSLLGFR